MVEMATPTKRIWRSGVRFDCPYCGKLLKDDEEHAPALAGACHDCRGDLRMVGRGDSPNVGDANWYRCLACQQLYMHRRGELVKTGARTGFEEFTQF